MPYQCVAPLRQWQIITSVEVKQSFHSPNGTKIATPHGFPIFSDVLPAMGNLQCPQLCTLVRLSTFGRLARR